MMKKMQRTKRRRTTFCRMFLKGMIIPVVITAALGACLKYFIYVNNRNYLIEQPKKITDGYLKGAVNAQYTNVHPGMEPFKVALRSYIDMVYREDFYNPAAWVEPKVRSAVITFDKDGNFVTTSREKMAANIQQFDGDRRWYTYDPQTLDLPELHRLFELASDNTNTSMLRLKSVYINEETLQMVPHVVEMELFARGLYKESVEPTETVQVMVDDVPEGYKLLEICEDTETDAEGNLLNYPRAIAEGIWGTPAADFDSLEITCRTEIADNLRYGYDTGYSSDFGDHMQSYYVTMLPFDENLGGIYMHIEADFRGFAVWRRLYFVLAVLFALQTLIVLTVCLIKNARNKAQYAFEDYQRALTNNLAHDLKTPLAVIGGYAENLIEMRQAEGGEKELEYLRSIMKNVTYTDDIIRKTLKLSETEQVKAPHRSEIDVRQLAEQLAEKYRTALSARGITLTIEGSGTITADADLLADAVENLLSNAVKYTKDGGKIIVLAEKKRLAFTNDVAENVDTKDLLMPFVKGDKSRGDKRSSGLGLAIASAAAAQNGFTLRIGCRDKVFTAEILF